MTEKGAPEEAGKSVVLSRVGCLKSLRWITALAFAFYGIGLVFLFLAMRFVGECNVTTAFLLYLPPSLWLLPLPIMAIMGLLFCRRLMLPMTGLLLLWAWIGLGYRLGGEDGTSEVAPGDNLTVITYNRGQHGGQSFQPFKNLIQPDLVCMQEAGNRADTFKRDPGYAEFVHAASVGEHTLLSRFPLVQPGVLVTRPGGKGSCAARFVVDWQGRSVAVYSVHLQTPRDTLKSLARGGFLYGVLGFPGSPWEEKKRLTQNFWDQQMADVDYLLAQVRLETLPVIVAGDFNAPNVGWIYQRLAGELQDSHAQAGRGFGFTFPGKTRNPLSLGGPWLRIDYVFAGSAWQVTRSTVEADRGSQHRAVAATLLLRSSGR